MPSRLAVILSASLLAAAGAAAAATVATPATLAEVLGRAAAGEAIQLAPGSYEAVALKDRHWSPPVTVDATAATLRGVRLDAVSGLTWHGGSFDGGDVVRSGINVWQSDHLVIDGVTFRHFVRNGIGLGTVSDARITNNTITDSGSDGIDVALSRRIVLDHNRCVDFRPTEGAHPDCIQLWSHPEQPPTADIVISNNQAIGDTQGFTAFNNPARRDATGKVVNDGGFDRITIENNLSRVSTYHGVTVDDCRHCIVRNNRAETLPNAKYPRVKAWIKAFGIDLTVCGNVAVAWPNDPGQRRCSADEATRQAGS